jgi:hypothetical protein
LGRLANDYICGMGLTKVSNSEELVQEANEEALFTALVKQLNKDLHLANITYAFENDRYGPEFLVEFGRMLYDLIQHKFDEYLNFLYIVDVPEYQIKNIKETDLERLVPQVAFLILKREWQKVWYKSRY